MTKETKTFAILFTIIFATMVIILCVIACEINDIGTAPIDTTVQQTTTVQTTAPVDTTVAVTTTKATTVQSTTVATTTEPPVDYMPTDKEFYIGNFNIEPTYLLDTQQDIPTEYEVLKDTYVFIGIVNDLEGGSWQMNSTMLAPMTTNVVIDDYVYYGFKIIGLGQPTSTVSFKYTIGEHVISQVDFTFNLNY